MFDHIIFYSEFIIYFFIAVLCIFKVDNVFDLIPITEGMNLFLVAFDYWTGFDGLGWQILNEPLTMCLFFIALPFLFIATRLFHLVDFFYPVRNGR